MHCHCHCHQPFTLYFLRSLLQHRTCLHSICRNTGYNLNDPHSQHAGNCHLPDNTSYTCSPIQVGFAVYKVAWQRFFSEYFGFPPVSFHQCFFFLLLFSYNPLCVLVFCTSPYHAFLSLTRYVQFLPFNFFKSFNTSSSNLFFGFPLNLIPMGFHSVIFPTGFFSSILCSYVFMYTFSSHQLLQCIIISNSLSFFSFTEPYILLNICVSNTSK